ncbi:MAG: ribonucleoside-diphosphate reductase, adenosylcobalamin-dependent, partial [Phenylobacterium sp.]|nr:ribonucleoside-diphosphate reductase, adenosylcobalamin-dependent [Phenylobacterium sp.]
LAGATYKLKWPESAHAVYVTINDVVDEAGRRPFEIFINSKNMEHYAWTLGLTRMISAVFRRGGDIAFVVEELKAVFDPRGGAWMEGRYVPSLLAAIGAVIDQHLAQQQGVGDATVALAAEPASTEPSHSPAGKACACPRCGGFELVKREGCETCVDCGYSKCG